MRRWMFAGAAALWLLAQPVAGLWAAEGPPQRDQWYLEGRETVTAPAFAPVIGTGIAPVRDQWYLEP